MSSALSNNLETKNYSLFINSTDKLSGSTNNNAKYDIGWDDFLPREYDNYKMSFSFQSVGGNYKDTTSTFTITQINGNQLTVSRLTGTVGIGQYLTGSASITSTFTATISNNLLTQIGATTTGTVTTYQSLTGSNTATFTATFADAQTAFTADITGTTLSVTATSGSIYIGMTVSGTGLTGLPTILSQVSGTNGGVGVYTLSVSQSTFSALACNGTIPAMNISAITTGIIAVSATLSFTGQLGNPTIISQLSGTTGSTGLYAISTSHTLGSRTVTLSGPYSLAGNTISYLSSGTINTSGAVYALATSLGISGHTFSVSGTYNYNLATNATYITAGSNLSSGSGTFTLSNTFGVSPAGLSIAGTGNVVYSGVKIVIDTLGKTYSYDTSSKSNSLVLGYGQRDIQTGTSTSNSFSAFYLQFPAKTVCRPNQNIINVRLYNNFNNLLLLDTDSTGNTSSDCTNYSLILEFVPIPESANSLMKF